MKNNIRNSYYIIPVYNKESLISKVLYGILNSHNYNTIPIIVIILDGCVDNSENIVLDILNNTKKYAIFHIIKENNVHEILCLNSALNYIQNICYPKNDDLIFSIQDDVILDEPNINLKFDSLFNFNNKLGYISMRLGVSVYEQNGDLKECDYIESEFGHWNQLNWNFHKTLPYNTFVTTEVAIRSPTCMLWNRYKSIGFFDENLAPCGFDCHDMSIRLNKHGYINGVYALKFNSDVNWGTMRTETQSIHNKNMDAIYNKNRKYIINKHKEYFKTKL
jgi:hypothetical protein